MGERLIGKGKRTKRYADHVQRCRELGLPLTPFRLFAEIEDEYEREWEIANYEYEHNGDTNERDEG